MIGGKCVLAIVPARGGSKGLPGKNILPVGGRPLIAWSIEAANNSTVVDAVEVSTDDPKIAAVVRECGCSIDELRPAELASDTAKIEDVILHVLRKQSERPDYIVLLQPTSPLRTAADIDAAAALCLEREAPACVSVCKVEKSPYWMATMNERGQLSRFAEDVALLHRRQDLPDVYAYNGAVYVASVPWFEQNRTFFSAETVGYVMPRERSLDVDTPLDLLFVEAVINAEARPATAPAHAEQ